MGTHFQHFSFPDDKSTFHYLNPDHNGTFRIPGETEVGNEFFLDGRLDKSTTSHGFAVTFQETENENSQAYFVYDVNLDTGDITQSSSAGEPINIKGLAQRLFKRRNSFRIHIKTGADFYQVKINHEEPTVLKVRDKNAITKPNFISIIGDIQIQSFHIQKNGLEKGIPYMSVPSNAKVGDIFHFSGKAPKAKDPEHGCRITIDFTEKPTSDKQVIFHFNPRFNYEKNGVNTVCNAKKNGTWETEEVHGNPLTEGAHYKLDIVVEKEQFRCFVNEAEFCTFKHRMPPQGIAWVNIYNNNFQSQLGDMASVVMNRLSCRTPKKLGYKCSMSLDKVQPSSVTYFPKLPVNMKLPDELKIGSCIYISGVFKPPSDRGSTLTCEIKQEKADPIIQMKADCNTKKVTVFNKKPSVKVFPFRERGHFHIQIFCADGNTLILSVDETYVHTFHPTDGFSKASHVYVNGDVRISAVAVIQAGTSSKE